MNYDKSVIKYGMTVVGKSLRYIEKGDLNGLKTKISEKIKEEFQIDIDKGGLVNILKNAADKLSKSIRIGRLEHAAKLFDHIDYKDKAEKVRKVLDHYCKDIYKSDITNPIQF